MLIYFRIKAPKMPGLAILKKFAIVLQYRPKCMMVLQRNCKPKYYILFFFDLLFSLSSVSHLLSLSQSSSHQSPFALSFSPMPLPMTLSLPMLLNPALYPLSFHPFTHHSLSLSWRGCGFANRIFWARLTWSRIWWLLQW